MNGGYNMKWESKEKQIEILKEFGYKLVYEDAIKEIWEDRLKLSYINLKGFIFSDMQTTLRIVQKTLEKREKNAQNRRNNVVTEQMKSDT